MSGIDNRIKLDVGEISKAKTLGCYYQDITPALIHIKNKKFASLDEHGIPYYISGDKKLYKVVLVIQYGLMCFDLIEKKVDAENNIINFKKCLNWLDSNSELYMGAKVWRSERDEQYQLEDGWISGMYQGQALSLYLRGAQLFKNPEYLDSSELIFKSFFLSYEQGGFVRRDNLNCLWFEEYPSKTPSFVLNGFIYAMFGIYDLYRVTGRNEVLEIWNDCVHTLVVNLHKYDVWYWSLYDQLKKQLVSYYYQKNVHVPILKIMYQLTNNTVFLKYSVKWEKNLNSFVHRNIVKIMYRLRPRIHIFKK